MLRRSWRTVRRALHLTTKRSGRDPLGPAGERCAAKTLRRSGYTILRRNLRTRVGEIDLLCKAPDGKTVVIVEVKTRRLNAGDSDANRIRPEANIHAHKRAKLIQLAKTVGKNPQWADRPIRIDVIAIDWPNKGKPALRHYENAVTLSS